MSNALLMCLVFMFMAPCNLGLVVLTCTQAASLLACLGVSAPRPLLLHSWQTVPFPFSPGEPLDAFNMRTTRCTQEPQCLISHHLQGVNGPFAPV